MCMDAPLVITMRQENYIIFINFIHVLLNIKGDLNHIAIMNIKLKIFRS